MLRCSAARVCLTHHPHPEHIRWHLTTKRANALVPRHFPGGLPGSGVPLSSRHLHLTYVQSRGAREFRPCPVLLLWHLIRCPYQRSNALSATRGRERSMFRTLFTCSRRNKAQKPEMGFVPCVQRSECQSTLTRYLFQRNLGSKRLYVPALFLMTIWHAYVPY